MALNRNVHSASSLLAGLSDMIRRGASADDIDHLAKDSYAHLLSDPSIWWLASLNVWVHSSSMQELGLSYVATDNHDADTLAASDDELCKAGRAAPQ